MEKSILLSILIPTYNGASKFLDRTMSSIIEGVSLCEEGTIEVVLSNNASTDNTLEFLKQYDKYPFSPTPPLPVLIRVSIQSLYRYKHCRKQCLNLRYEHSSKLSREFLPCEANTQTLNS